MPNFPPRSELGARPSIPRSPLSMRSGIPSEFSVSTVRPPSQFLEYWQIIQRNLGWIGLLALIGMAAGWLFATSQRPMYQARTVLDIRSLNENFLNPREGSSAGTTESVLPESYIQTEIKILQSDSIRKRALDKLSFPQQAPDQRSDLPFWRSIAGWFRPARVPFKDLIADAGRRVKVRAVGNTRIVEVFCDAQDGQLAASLCASLARAYIENNLESRVQSTKETSDWLQSQLDDVRKRLTKAENDLKDAGKTTDFGTALEGMGSPDQERLRQLQAELSRSQTERIVKESNYLVAGNHDADSLPLEMDAGPIREYRLKLAELRRQLSELSATMTPEHYRVRELTMQISEVEQAVQSERNGMLRRLSADLEASRQRESMISAAYEKQAAQVSQRGDLAVRYDMIKHDVDSERQLYETLLQKVGEVGLTAAMRTSTISIVDPAVAPLKPYSPNSLADLGIGFLGGSALGIAFSLLRAHSDRTLRIPGEASTHLHLRELGVIPSIRGRGFRLRLRRPENPPQLLPSDEVVARAQNESDAVLIPRMPPRSVALATWLRVPEIAEAFSGTMTSLLLGLNFSQTAPLRRRIGSRMPSDGSESPITLTPSAFGARIAKRTLTTLSSNDIDRPTQVFVLTSPEAGDGKTTVATNLAIALTQIGRRVVLVDGDLRKPRLRGIFDTPEEISLATFLAQDDQLEKRPLDQLVAETQIPNLYVIPTQPAFDGISSRLHSSRLRALLSRLREEFDVVIIDSPPMQNIADARVLGWLADGVLLVFRAGKTTREAALAAHECLIEDGVRVFGTILNDWNPRSGRYGAYAS